MSQDGQGNGRGKGGPKTAAGKQVSRLNGVKHGLRSRLVRLGTLPRVRHCVLRTLACGCQDRGAALDDPCPLLVGLQREWLATLRGLRHIRPEHHHLCELLVDALVLRRHGKQWLAHAGYVRVVEGAGLAAQPIVADLARLETEIRRLSETLGLTPMAAKALGVADAIDVPSLQEYLARRYPAEPEPGPDGGDRVDAPAASEGGGP